MPIFVRIPQHAAVCNIVQYLTSLGIQAFAKHSVLCAVQPAV